MAGSACGRCSSWTSLLRSAMQQNAGRVGLHARLMIPIEVYCLQKPGDCGAICASRRLHTHSHSCLPYTGPHRQPVQRVGRCDTSETSKHSKDRNLQIPCSSSRTSIAHDTMAGTGALPPPRHGVPPPQIPRLPVPLERQAAQQKQRGDSCIACSDHETGTSRLTAGSIAVLRANTQFADLSALHDCHNPPVVALPGGTAGGAQLVGGVAPVPQPPVLLAGAGQPPQLAVLVHRVHDPVDARVLRRRTQV